MRKLFKLLSSLLLVFLVCSCERDIYELPNNLVVHDFTWKGLNAYYLHQDSIADLSDTRFSSDVSLERYLKGFSTHNELYENLLLPSDSKSTLVEDFTTLDETPLREDFTNGLEFGLFKEQDSDTVIGYALDILPLSYAASQPIARGEYFYAVIDINNDTIQLTKDNYKDLLIDYPQNTLKLLMADYDGEDLTFNNKTVALVKEMYSYEPVSIQKIIPSDGNTIGYVMYNNSFSSDYINDLNNTLLNFKNQSVNEFVLDLRYCVGGGGFVEDISKIASMITGQFQDETLLKERWNRKAQSWFIEQQPDSIITKFPSKINATTPINSLELEDVYIVLNGDNFTGSSAVELLINSLKPYINVHIVGTQTQGNHTGSITLYDSDDYNNTSKNETHTVALQPIVLEFLNKDDATYSNGFTSDIRLCDHEDVLNLGVLGDISDPILNKIINFINSTNTSTPICNSKNFEFIYHSIAAKRMNDTGVFIKRILPNTL